MSSKHDQNKDVTETSYLLESNEKCIASSKKDVSQYKAPSTGRKMAVMSSCLALHFFTMGLAYGLAVMYAELIDVFNAKRADAAFIQSLFMGITVGGGVLFSGIVRRLGPGPCTVVGALVGCAGLMASSFATSLTTVIVTTGIVASTGLSICYLTPFITISWVFHENPGLPLIFLTVGASVGQFIIPLLYELLIAEYQWSGAFMVLSGLALNCVPCGILIYCSRDIFVTGTKEQQCDNTIAKTETKCDLSLLKDVVIYILLINFFLLASTGSQEALFLVDIMESRGYERQTGSLMVSLLGIGNLLGRIVGGLLRLKCKIPTVYHWIYLLPVLAVSHVLVINMYDYGPLIASCLLYATVFGITFAQSPAIMFEASGLARYPQGVSLMNTMFGLGDVFCGQIGGSIKDAYGKYDLSFYIAAGTSIYSAISTSLIAWLLHRRRVQVRLSELYKEHSGVRYTKLKDEM